MEDPEIVALYWEREERALEETEKKYGRLLRQLAFSILRSEADSEEAFNDTLLAAWNAMPEQRPLNLRAFLCRIVRNTALNKRRGLTARKRDSQYDVCLDELSAVLPAGEGVEERFDAAETARLINRFLYNEKEQARRIFLLRYYFFLPPEQIAERLGMKDSTVRSILFRTRNRLLEYLTEEGVTV